MATPADAKPNSTEIGLIVTVTQRLLKPIQGLPTPKLMRESFPTPAQVLNELAKQKMLSGKTHQVTLPKIRAVIENAAELATHRFNKERVVPRGIIMEVAPIVGRNIVTGKGAWVSARGAGLPAKLAARYVKAIQPSRRIPAHETDRAHFTAITSKLADPHGVPYTLTKDQVTALGRWANGLSPRDARERGLQELARAHPQLMAMMRDEILDHQDSAREKELDNIARLRRQHSTRSEILDPTKRGYEQPVFGKPLERVRRPRRRPAQ